MNHYYPISLNLKDKLCLVIGGGPVALRKINRLLGSGAVVQVMAPAITHELATLLQAYPKSSWIKAYYTGPEDLQGASLVFAATNDPTINKKILKDANLLGIFVNMATHGHMSDFIVPSSFNRGDLQVSVSTGAKVPGLSKAIKESLEKTLGPEYATLINLFKEVRDRKEFSLLREMTADYVSILESLKSESNTD